MVKLFQNQLKMCLIVKSGCKIEIAEKDITTYKYIISYEDYWTGIFFSNFPFAYNKLQKAKCLCLESDELYVTMEHLRVKDSGYGSVITEGFHSYIREPNHFPFDKKVICIIPKGSEYCFGEYDKIVSNQIIVFKTKEDYDRYITSKISSD